MRGEGLEPRIVDPAEAPGGLLGTGDFESLPFFDRGNELGGLPQAFRRSRVEPGEAPAKLLDLEALRLSYRLLRSDLELAARPT